MTGSRFRFGLLGPLEVFADGRPVPVKAAKLRTLLAVLLLHANEHVPLDVLVDRLWGDEPPGNARRTIQVYVMRLRGLLDDGPGRSVIQTRPGGYLLSTEPGAVDLAVFRHLVRQARDTAGPAARAGLLREAEALWRGPALVDVRSEHFGSLTLDEELLAAIELRVEADLDLGCHAEVLPDLRSLVGRHPLRERLWAFLIIALGRSGRQAEALEAYQDVRRRLADELGVDPGAELRDAHAVVLAGAEPVAPARPAALSQLPRDLGDFVGRAELIDQVTGLLVGEMTPVVVLCGQPGVGKTALAVHVAHRVRESFPDGQLFVDLRGYDAEPALSVGQALTQFLRSLGTPAEHIPLDVDEQAVLFRSLLSDRRVLVVLDNAADAEQIRKLLPAGTGCAVLVTSRDELRGLVVTHGARLLALGVFNRGESSQLLSDMLGAAVVRAEPEASRELARLCANLPLALRIAAANITGTIAEYVTELRASGITALAVPGDARAAVSSAFDLSYAALNPLAQRVFRSLAWLPGTDFDAATATVLTGEEPAVVASVLRVLTGAHLVQRAAPGRFHFHDLIRGYAIALGDPCPLTPVYDWYLARVRGAAVLLYPEMLRAQAGEVLPFDSADEAWTWLRAERTNLVASVRHAADHGPRAMAWRLTDALRGYFWLQTNGTDWATAAEAGLRAAVALDDPVARVHMHHSLGTLRASFSEHDQALIEYHRALSLAHDHALLPAVAASWNNIGIVRQDQGLPDRAVQAYENALVAARSDAAAEATIRVNLGSAHWEMGSLTCAHALFESALLALRDVEAHQARVEVQDSLARICLDLGELDRAATYAAAALELARRSGHPRTLAEAHNTLGATCAQQGDLTAALAHHEHALQLAVDVGHRRAEVASLLGLAAATSDAELALSYCERAYFVVVDAGLRSRLGRVRTALATVRLRLGDHVAAVEDAAAAVEAHRGTGHRLGEARALCVLADAVEVLSGVEAARPHRASASEIFAELGAAEPRPLSVT
ncbi:BTAD domain-containing putative transcriptional regulator [Lentzea sp. NBRC 102530]|uniref:AfsR/SARP family transcriptional regulator n=1 Tax=Lentzea sp. NBRC 102530 TaxID=3032201 RepID=UPI0024A3FC99|nr:BTAD domain-containing putative transcriptional regulator [Lentzea sp. NBRC 102530]GLY51453.1 SARP family transcriptional regulator [Lentzea sp. NBRC 102530]